MSESYLSLPFRITDAGRAAVADEYAVIRERLEQILFTSPGERVMLPDFGCGIDGLVFVGANPALEAAAEYKIARALQHDMGNKVMINGVDVHSDEEKLYIEVIYTVVRDLEQQRVTFQATPSGGSTHE